MARCTPTEVIGETYKTPESDTTGQTIVVAPCKCLSFDELKALIAANNIDMPKPNHIHSSQFETLKLKVPDELLMAIIAKEAPCEGNKYMSGKKRIDIEFDPCALNDTSNATGLTQILNITIEDFIDKGLIANPADKVTERKNLCGNPALAIKYGSWNIQLKWVYARKEKDLVKRFEMAVNNCGDGTADYGTDRIEEMKLLQASYTKETLIEHINNEK